MRVPQLIEFPLSAHGSSGLLTLQMAIAHCDMPVESGPTMYLPYSQCYAKRYLAIENSDFARYFHEHAVQLDLCKGDVVAFHPGLFHAAGANRTSDYNRLANLLQISSAFGRPIEVVNRRAMCETLLEVLQRRLQDRWPSEKIANVVFAAAEGYPFPTNLDLEPPGDERIPLSEAQVILRAVGEGWTRQALSARLQEIAERRSPIQAIQAQAWARGDRSGLIAN
jgi:ectoine hydroxylase-related dioxygenase (phytanoyl-CoA dioxygenase family)